MIAATRALLVAVLLATSSVACDSRPPLSFAPESLPNGYLGLPYSAVITISGAQTPVGDVYADPALPPGLKLNWDEKGDRNRIELTGTPTTAGTYELTISAWCLGTNVSGQTGAHQYRIVVFSPDAPSPT